MANEAEDDARLPFAVFLIFYIGTVILSIWLCKRQRAHDRLARENRDKRAQKKAMEQIHSVKKAHRTLPVQKKIVEELKVSSTLKLELIAGRKRIGGLNNRQLQMVGLYTEAILTYRVIALSIQDAFVNLTRSSNPEEISVCLDKTLDLTHEMGVRLHALWDQSDIADKFCRAIDRSAAKRPQDSIQLTTSETTNFQWPRVMADETTELERIKTAAFEAIELLPADVQKVNDDTDSATIAAAPILSGGQLEGDFRATVRDTITAVLEEEFRYLATPTSVLQQLELKMDMHVSLMDRNYTYLDAIANAQRRKDPKRTRYERARLAFWQLLPGPVHRNPYFFTVLFIIYMWKFFLFISVINTNEGNLEQGPYGTFLDVPSVYDFEKSKAQRRAIPVVYGIMHCVLLSLGFLPLCMCRGFHRDLRVTKFFSALIPFDDMEFLHILFGEIAILGILVAGGIWLIVQGYVCFTFEDVNATTAACSAFAPTVQDAKKGDGTPERQLLYDSISGAMYVDPRDNVLFLREVVWITWFFIIPLMFFAHWTTVPQWLPVFIRKYWWEMCFYLHVTVAWVTVLVAFYARFEVFWPVIPPWTLLAIDNFRERFFRSWWSTVTPSKDITLFYDKDIPKTIAINMPNSTFKVGGGQWLYIKINEIDRVWHPFTVASCSFDPSITLYIGVRGERHLWDGKTQIPKLETWTYKMFKLMQAKLQGESEDTVEVQIKGPYGSPFTTCYKPKYMATVLIGAGTGLGGALSVLKEVLHRRARGDPGPKYVWFVWSCKDVEQLQWCWDALLEVLYWAWDNQSLAPREDWNAMTCNMLDWLGITIYVSQTKNLRGMLQRRKTIKGSRKDPTSTSAVNMTHDASSGTASGTETDAAQPSAATRHWGVLRDGMQREAEAKQSLTLKWQELAKKVHLQHLNETEATTGFEQLRRASRRKQKGKDAPIEELYGTLLENRQPYDFGPMELGTAESMLQDKYELQRMNFLIRQSTRVAANYYILTLIQDSGGDKQYKFFHYKLEHDEVSKELTLEDYACPGETLTPSRMLTSIHELVEHFKQKTDGCIPTLLWEGQPNSTAVQRGSGPSVVANDAITLKAEQLMDARVLAYFKRLKQARMRKEIQRWLEEQVLPCSMDSKMAPIVNVLRWVQTVVTQSTSHSALHDEIDDDEDASADAGAPPISICYCGNAATGLMLQQQVEKVAALKDCDMEFSTDSHAG
eukprot:m.1265825 g.1265825  ORF g.1265825 m.1265825 type:complete len:1213 (-) comp24738_c0_seq3:4981-8619(-)